MNRRADNRIDMKLPCRLFFPRVWLTPVAGFTANLHRNGVLVACDLSVTRPQLPAVGEKANVRILLPANPAFSRKCLNCDTALIRVRQVESGQWQFALRIRNVSFGEWAAENIQLVDLDAERFRYLT